MIQYSSDQALSIRDIDANIPEEIVQRLRIRFYHAREEFGKLKRHQAQQKKRKGYRCPWGEKLSEEAWVERIRRNWSENEPEEQSKRGPKGWDFLVMLKIWLYAAFFDAEQNAPSIYNMLGKNPLYARLCGLPSEMVGEDEKFDIPAERTIRHFNQVMYTFKLWSDFKCMIVLVNLECAVFEFSDELVIDPTHLDAFASVDKKCLACKICPKKRCNFYQVTCEMTGIVSKSKNFKLPGVKLNIASLPESEIVIEALACRGNPHDSQLLRPLLEKLVIDYPQLHDRVKKILADGAYDGAASTQTTQEVIQAQLVNPINPGNRKPIIEPANGIDKINPNGVPICKAGHDMVLAGRDHHRDQFIWVCPVFHQQHGDSALHCSSHCKRSCCPGANNGRVFRVDRQLTPQIDWDNPQFLASVNKIYNSRTSVERAISRCKRVMKFERFYNRGRKPLQAHGDRYVIAVQLVALVAHKLNRPLATRRYRLTG